MNLKFWKKSEKSLIEEAIDDQLTQLNCVGRGTQEEAKAIDNLERLANVQVQVEGQKRKIDPNTIIGGFVTIGATLLMLNYEKLGVITSKAMGLLPKPRL